MLYRCLVQLGQVMLRCGRNAAGCGSCSNGLLLHLLLRLPLGTCRLA
jgi:hypothetical protein